MYEFDKIIQKLFDCLFGTINNKCNNNIRKNKRLYKWFQLRHNIIGSHQSGKFCTVWSELGCMVIIIVIIQFVLQKIIQNELQKLFNANEIITLIKQKQKLDNHQAFLFLNKFHYYSVL